MPKNTLLIFNADVLTMNRHMPKAHWLYVTNGYIRDMGLYDGHKKYRNSVETVIDAEHKTVLPGFIDSHVFLLQTGINAQGINLSHVKHLEEVFDLLSDQTKNRPSGQFIRATQFDEFQLDHQRFPTRSELDRVTPNHPVWINRKDMHTSILNTSALSRINVPFNLSGNIIENGVPTGIIKDRANAAVRKFIYNNLTDKEKDSALYLASSMALKKGITTVVAIDGGFLFGDLDHRYVLSKIDKLPIDIVQFSNTTAIDEQGNQPIKHCGSYFLDGTFTSKTAALFKPYCNDPENTGSLYFSEEALLDLFEKTHLLDMQIAVHTLGDRAIDLALRTFEKILAKYPKTDHRHRIEYFSLADVSMIQRARELQLYVTVIPSFISHWCHQNSMYETHIGAQRMDQCYWLRDLQNSGITLLGGSDSDVTDMNPFFGIDATVNAVSPRRQLSLSEALKMFTINGAKGIFQENIKGSLEKNKQADFIVLKENIEKRSLAQIRDLSVQKTFRKGALVYAA